MGYNPTLPLYSHTRIGTFYALAKMLYHQINIYSINNSWEHKANGLQINKEHFDTLYAKFVLNYFEINRYLVPYLSILAVIFERNLIL